MPLERFVKCAERCSGKGKSSGGWKLRALGKVDLSYQVSQKYFSGTLLSGSLVTSFTWYTALLYSLVVSKVMYYIVHALTLFMTCAQCWHFWSWNIGAINNVKLMHVMCIDTSGLREKWAIWRSWHKFTFVFILIKSIWV